MNQMTNDRMQGKELTIANSGDIDLQIATAHKFPRKRIQAIKDIMTLACSDRETAENCFYVLERKAKGGKVNIIKGPSVRLAEIATSCWGNMRTQSIIMGHDKKVVTARAFCWDLESNNAVALDVQRRITTSEGKLFSDDMIAVTGNAAASIAYRNAVFKVIPMALIHQVFEKAMKVAIGDKTTLVERREQMLKFFKSIGVTEEDVVQYLDRKTVEEIDLDDLGVMLGICNAIREGERTAADIFGGDEESEDENSGKKTYSSKSDELADKFDQDNANEGNDATDGTSAESGGDEEPSGTRKYSGVVGTVSDDPPQLREGEILEGDRVYKPKNGGKAKAKDKPSEPKVNLMSECRDFLKEQGVRCIESDPAKGQEAYMLPNNRILVLSEVEERNPKDGCDYLLTTNADTFDVVKYMLKTAKENTGST